MPETKNYIGVKVIKAEPMTLAEFTRVHQNKQFDGSMDLTGYRVEYPDGYVSWSPKGPFESAYREITDKEIEFLVR